jgi:hypothetical protein
VVCVAESDNQFARRCFEFVVPDVQLFLFCGNQKLLSANYRMLLALTGGEKVIPQKVEDGFFDDLPTRFEKIIVNLEAKIGLQ